MADTNSWTIGSFTHPDQTLLTWTWLFCAIMVNLLFLFQLAGWTCAAWPTWRRFWTTGGSTSWTRWEESCKTTTSLCCRTTPGTEEPCQRLWVEQNRLKLQLVELTYHCKSIRISYLVSLSQGAPTKWRTLLYLSELAGGALLVTLSFTFLY